LHRHQPVKIVIRERGQRADIEIAAAIVLEGRERRMLAEDVGGGFVGEGIGKAEAPGDFAQDPPVGPRFAGRRQEGALARDAPFRIGDRA